jgi:hypothetical protein
MSAGPITEIPSTAVLARGLIEGVIEELDRAKGLIEELEQQREEAVHTTDREREEAVRAVDRREREIARLRANQGEAVKFLRSPIDRQEHSERSARDRAIEILLREREHLFSDD